MSLQRKINKNTILLVEPDVEKRDKARSFLLIQGAKKVFVATDFEDAFTLAMKASIDYVICDYRLTNEVAQNFLKKMKVKKLLDSDDKLIMLSDFYTDIENIEKQKTSSVLGGSSTTEIDDRPKTMDESYKAYVREDPAMILGAFCKIKAQMLLKATNTMIEASILNINPEELTVTISSSSLEKIEAYARQIKFESSINGVIKHYTIIGDMKLVDDSDQFTREFELKVPEQYKDILLEIENDLFVVHDKTKALLSIMKGDQEKP
ncbi:MAG: hypothetical protein JNM93_08980 [Bacteriovoracaceae bacterium]|nr:hypothetical protein [Bacteriovoracaceae bacterium]